MGPQTSRIIADTLSAEPVFVETGLLSASALGSHPGGTVERQVARYAVTRTDRRAVFLIDISGFSLSPPERQAAQLTMLQFSLNVAAESLRDSGDGIDPAQSSTGDGFYVWNRNKGCEADIALFRLFSLVLVVYARLQGEITDSPFPPIRSCFGIGSHYSFRQPGPLGDTGADYIVGDVTIELARLIEKAQRYQILFSDFDRMDDDDEIILDTRGFLDRAVSRIENLPIVEAVPGSITSLKIYLTGPKIGNDRTVRRISVTDKHGIPHTAYNAKINVRFEPGVPLYLGLQDGALQFDETVRSLDG